jgi:hypothetical protein
MDIRRNGMGEPDDPIDDEEYQWAMERYNESIMNEVEILLEDDNHRSFWKEDEE